MIKRYRENDFWYEIATAPDPGPSGWTRQYRVTCRHCGCLKTFRSGRLSDEKMRKHLIREGWEIGRVTNMHACPSCSERHHEKPPQPKKEEVLITPPDPLVMLEAAWAACSEDEREVFARKLYKEYYAPMPDDEEQPAVASQTETVMIDDGDDEPADWWLEIQNTRPKDEELTK